MHSFRRSFDWGPRVSAEDEVAGLDLSEHSATAYQPASVRGSSQGPSRIRLSCPTCSKAPVGPAHRYPELVADEPPVAALQDRRAADPACPVLHPATRRKQLDIDALSANALAHRATRVASDVIGRTAQTGRP